MAEAPKKKSKEKPKKTLKESAGVPAVAAVSADPIEESNRMAEQLLAVSLNRATVLRNRSEGSHQILYCFIPDSLACQVRRMYLKTHSKHMYEVVVASNLVLFGPSIATHCILSYYCHLLVIH